MNALADKGFDINNPEHIIIVCGDLFDRGDETQEVFDFVSKMSEQNRLVYVTGNHEDLLFDCLKEIFCGKCPGSHHFSNGTVKTIASFCDSSEHIVYDVSKRKFIAEKMQPVLDFISDNCCDYAELGNTIFVHGWVPCYQGLEDFRDATEEDWQRARWNNGMEMWKHRACREEGKTIVCGHWHSSWGWSHISQKYKEFPQITHEDFNKAFKPWFNDGIIAIDACTAYSKQCNVVVFDNGGNVIE